MSRWVQWEKKKRKIDPVTKSLSKRHSFSHENLNGTHHVPSHQNSIFSVILMSILVGCFGNSLEFQDAITP